MPHHSSWCRSLDDGGTAGSSQMSVEIPSDGVNMRHLTLEERASPLAKSITWRISIRAPPRLLQWDM